MLLDLLVLLLLFIGIIALCFLLFIIRGLMLYKFTRDVILNWANSDIEAWNKEKILELTNKRYSIQYPASNKLLIKLKIIKLS